MNRISFSTTQARTANAYPTRCNPRHAIATDNRTRPPPRQVPEPTPPERRIAEVWEAVKGGAITLTDAQIAVIILSLLVLCRNGNHGIRNQCGDVLTEKMIAAEYLTRFGKTISERTIRASKKRLALCFAWFGWCATPAGYTYRMHSDGVMPMSGKCGKMVGALGNALPLGKVLTKKVAASKGKEFKTVSGRRTADRVPPPPDPTPPPDPVAVKLARLAAWAPTDDDIDFGMDLHLTERDIDGEAARMRAWFIHPDHPERRAWVPVDPSAKFRQWLERGAMNKAKAKAEREAAEFRRQRAEADLGTERRLAGQQAQEISPDLGDDYGDDDDLGDDDLADAYDGDDSDDEDAWRLRLTGSDDPPPPSRSEIIARMREIAAGVTCGVEDVTP